MISKHICIYFWFTTVGPVFNDKIGVKIPSWHQEIVINSGLFDSLAVIFSGFSVSSFGFISY